VIAFLPGEEGEVYPPRPRCSGGQKLGVQIMLRISTAGDL